MEKLKKLLDIRLKEYNKKEFIDFDPVQIPHLFSEKKDIEISAFLTSIIAWGNRKMIINNARRLMSLMNNSPYKFVMEHVPNYCNTTEDNLLMLSDSQEWSALSSFCHRTFNGYDTLYFLLSLKRIYCQLGGLESVFTNGYNIDKNIWSAIGHFREKFFELPHQKRVEKHIANVGSNSAAKRINMFLRWMVRDDKHNIDFGLWKDIPMSALMLPLDVHVANVSRELGLLTRSQNDRTAVEQLTAILRKFDCNDPVKYDFALFGTGVFKNKNI